MASFLYIRSVYSLLSSMCTIESSVKKAKDLGYKAIGLVDRNVLAGAKNFYDTCLKENIKPVIGLEVDLNIDNRLFPIILYAKNDEGFINLMKLSSYVCTKDDKFVDIDTLNKYKDNNFLVLSSDNMPLSVAYDAKDDLDESLAYQDELFSKDYMVALIDHDIAINNNRDKKLKDILNNHGIKTLALSRTYYLNSDDYSEFEILKCIKDKRTLDPETYYEKDRYFLSIDTFNSLYDENDIKNTDILANNCNVKFEFKTDLPIYKTPKDVSSKDYLVALCKEGLKRRLKGNLTKEYSKRLEYELSVITKMNFENYFLIVYDFILYAKKNNILVGPGRGSAAGSLVSYCLGITEIDPIKYGLLFERFLNPERISMPDIDTDFPDDRRDEVVAYVRDKYGKDHVGHIITYGTLKAKQVLRDVGRVLNYSTYDMDSICKLLPYNPNITLEYSYNNIPLFRQKIESEEKYRNLYNIARKLEGFPRHESTHAAGIVFSLKPLNEIVPITSIESDLYSTQYTAEYLEALGLIKMDFLALRNLTIISEIVGEINKDKDFNIKNIPLDDPKTFKLIKDVNLLGVFQLESNGMQSLARKMKPNSLAELSMMIALFRPGPMDNIPTFLENRANPNKIKYPLDELKPILEETYGIIVYQEQIMAIARKLAGFTYGKADVLRKAMSKKKIKELEKLKPEFIDGCLNNGYKLEDANRIYDLIEKFANYGFNKSHSVAYGLVAYQMAYLKANYPLYFYKALLNGTIGSTIKTYDYIKECRSVGVKVLGVSINHSYGEYVLEDNSIRMPYGVIKDVGKTAIIKILEVRQKGIFKDYVDTVCRLTNSGVDKKALENLIIAGAFDEFGLSRYAMSESLINVVRYAGTRGESISILGDVDDSPIIKNVSDNNVVKAEKEKEVLGFYFSFNPIENVKKIKGYNCQSLRNIINSNGYVKGFGMIKRIKRIKTKKGDNMCFIDVYDDTGDISLAIMPNLYKIEEANINEAKYIYFEGNLEKESSVLVKKMEAINENTNS